MMRLTIIPVDNFVSVGGDGSHGPLDLSVCGIPSDVHALQWYDTRGWIEFRDDEDPFTPKPANQEITELPQWANACVQVWEQWTPPAPPEPVTPNTTTAV
jgi:hypothetical protein